MTYSRTESEIELWSPGDQTHGQDKIISSCCGVVLKEHHSCLLPPPKTRPGQDFRSDSRRDNGQLLGQLWGNLLPGQLRERFWRAHLCKRSWHSGGTRCAHAEVPTKRPFSQKRREGSENLGRKKSTHILSWKSVKPFHPSEPWSLFKLLVSVWLLLFVLPTQPVPGREETWLADRQCVFPSKQGVNWGWLQ